MQQLDTSLIVSRLHQHDSTVIGELFDAYGDVLYGVILRIVDTRELADQVLQETFVKVWKTGEGYDERKGRLFTWLHNIAHNTALDATRMADLSTSSMG